FVLAGSVKLGLLAGALCAVTSAGAVAAALRLGPATLEGATAPFALMLTALLLIAHLFSAPAPSSMRLLALPPWAARLPRSLVGERARRPAVALALVLVAAALLGLAVKLAYDGSPSLEGVGD